jgi:hypothetical protein
MQAETATVVKLEEGLELKSWGLEIAFKRDNRITQNS